MFNRQPKPPPKMCVVPECKHRRADELKYCRPHAAKVRAAMLRSGYLTDVRGAGHGGGDGDGGRLEIDDRLILVREAKGIAR